MNKSETSVITSRACRLIGNIAQVEKVALSLQASGVCLSLTNCLSDDCDTAVITMAIRAIRIMWNTKKFRFESLTLGTIYKIILILYKTLKKIGDITTGEKEEHESNIVILKRHNEPDRTISKEKLSNIIEKIEKHEVEINYEISKPERKGDSGFSMPVSKQKFELITGIMKCLLTITASTSNMPLVARNVDADRIGIAALMFLTEGNSKFRSMSLKVLSNLSSNTSAQQYLGLNNDLVPSVANLLLNSDTLEKPLEPNEKKFCLNILCLSSENACNRGKLRRSGVFKSLLSIATETESNQELALLIFTFYQFRFDQLGMETLLALGYIDVLIKIVTDIISTKEVDHITFDDPSLDEEKKIEQKTKKKRTMNEAPAGFNSFSKYMRYDPGSPSSSSGYGSNPYQFSPSRSSGYSPLNSPARSNNYDEDDDLNYSPVCSDNEDEQLENDTQSQDDILKFIYGNDEIGESDKFKEEEKEEILDEISDTDDETSHLTAADDDKSTSAAKTQENVPEILKQVEKNPLDFILLLLWKVSINNNDAKEFVRPSNLTTLLKVSTLIPKPNGKIFQILENIVVQIRNFVAILKQNLVFQIFELSRPPYDHHNCYSCSKMKSISQDLLQLFGTVASSGYGRGEIAHFLLTGEEEMKKKIAITLTYVISIPEILNDLLFKYNALDVVLNIIMTEIEFASIAADGITVMSLNLRIQLPSEDDVLSRIIPDEISDDDELIIAEGEVVKFIVKDGEIFFEKETLKNASDVFCSMLTGNFRESNLNEVKFLDYTIQGMEYFFRILKRAQNGKLKMIAPKAEMDVILQAYELSIRYIITEIQQPLLNVIKVILDETNVLNIFEWSLKNINQDLLIASIQYFLCGKIHGTKKSQLFIKANQSQFKDEWRHLMVDLIKQACSTFTQ